MLDLNRPTTLLGYDVNGANSVAFNQFDECAVINRFGCHKKEPMADQWLTCYAINNSLQSSVSIKDVGISILFRGQPAHSEAGIPCEHGVSGRCFPAHHALLGDLEQVAAVLGQ